ncbi:DCC1-like thiol-disulfide oxidoreductase family protein [Mucilaginibacter sp. HD30]
MKTLAKHLLLFDAECPICNAYSKAVVKSGLIDSDGRKAYQHELDAQTCPMVDRQRAADQIALVNLETGEVSYGAESILRLYAAQYPLLGRILTFQTVMWVLNKLYAFLSYNRRVIVPPTGLRYGLQPALKLHYRIAYLILTWFTTSVILTKYAALLADVVPVGGSLREYFICSGQIIFQGIVVSFVAKHKRWDYLGNMMTISFAGALLLCLMLIAAPFIGNHPIIFLAYFITVVGLMFLEHIRRSRLLQIGWWLTISWALYRIIVLLIILG